MSWTIDRAAHAADRAGGGGADLADRLHRPHHARPPVRRPAPPKPIMAKPNLNMSGRTAGSPDNAQGTHFFMINDSGTYFLRNLPPPAGGEHRCSTPRR